MVKRLAELHGGAVSVSSVPGSGSRFAVRLPLRSPAVAQAFAPVPAAIPAGA
jgi:signal transduction histidine kinase